MSTKPELPPLPSSEATLGQWQDYFSRLVKARGWDQASDLEVFLLFSEEVGELAKAYRRYRRLFSEEGRTPKRSEEELKQDIGDELADLFSYLLDIADRLEIDLAEAVLRKETINRDRDWS